MDNLDKELLNQELEKMRNDVAQSAKAKKLVNSLSNDLLAEELKKNERECGRQH